MVAEKNNFTLIFDDANKTIYINSALDKARSTSNGEALKRISDAKNVFPDYEIKVLVKPKKKSISADFIQKYLEKKPELLEIYKEMCEAKAISTRTAKEINLYKFSHIKWFYAVCPEVKGKNAVELENVLASGNKTTAEEARRAFAVIRAEVTKSEVEAVDAVEVKGNSGENFEKVA
mgnify:CR=1 FL=1